MSLSPLLAEPLDIGGVRLRNRVFLAPMSGVTDRPFRRLAWSHGAGLVVSEMVASGELNKGRADSIRRIERTGDAPHMVQLAGRDATALAEAARIAVGEGADIVDINMGCPAKKVTGGYCGSALMREPDHALRLIEAVVSAVDVPVTVKMRLGWDDDTKNAPDLARRAEQAGVRMITVHGRTRCQFYTGAADWTAIRAVRNAISLPLVVNGDIGSVADAALALELSGADAVMVGRAHYGAPWTAGLIASASGAEPEVLQPSTPAVVADYIVAHHDAMLIEYGREQGLRHARKHLGWYLDRFASDLGDTRTSIMTGTDPMAVQRAIREVFAAAPSTLR